MQSEIAHFAPSVSVSRARHMHHQSCSQLRDWHALLGCHTTPSPLRNSHDARLLRYSPTAQAHT